MRAQARTTLRGQDGLQEFRYERPTTCAEALSLLARDGARVLAGGTDLIPQMQEGRRHAGIVVDVKRVPELQEIAELPGGGWRLGAALSVAGLGRHAGLARAHMSLVEAGRLIGSLQIQSRASLGGNLCNAAPSADGVPLLLAHDAVAVIANAAATRRVPAEIVPTAPGRNALAPGEMLIALELPPPAARSASRYLRFTPRREMDIAIAGAGVRLDLDDAGMITVARVVLASVAPTPLRATAAEALLAGERPSPALFEAAGAAAAAEARPISDTRGSAEYRRDLVAVLTRRALADCSRQLEGLRA
jgi:carbon-monoxide dehydrogenase medium subunit